MYSYDKPLPKGEIKMKRIVSALSAVILAAASLGTGLAASAAEEGKTTPPGIAYSDIGGRVERFI